MCFAIFWIYNQSLMSNLIMGRTVWIPRINPNTLISIALLNDVNDICYAPIIQNYKLQNYYWQGYSDHITCRCPLKPTPPRQKLPTWETVYIAQSKYTPCTNYYCQIYSGHVVIGKYILWTIYYWQI